mmetsp:Transcript_16621/g.45625  ORF Transcript_16621/g.45625 Transcript_16621/m.45625 type:complete len:81 (-) Transcript_16621:965-1207(-)
MTIGCWFTDRSNYAASVVHAGGFQENQNKIVPWSIAEVLLPLRKSQLGSRVSGDTMASQHVTHLQSAADTTELQIEAIST